MTQPGLIRYGDRAWLVQYEPRATPALSTRLHRLTTTIRDALGDAVDDVVPGMVSICIHAAAHADVDALAPALRALVNRPLPDEAPAGRVVELHVSYGGEDGPDLAAVAVATGLTPEEVVRRHSAPVYHVLMLGFMPGFPYLGPIDPSIEVPRRSTPRVRVAAGSVGLAGPQTGVYPRESPGGWQIIGRTADWLFDPLRMPPTRLLPGDRVRFIVVRQPSSSR